MTSKALIGWCEHCQRSADETRLRSIEHEGQVQQIEMCLKCIEAWRLGDAEVAIKGRLPEKEGVS